MDNDNNLKIQPDSKGHTYRYRMDRNRRMEICRVGPDAIMVHVFHRDGRGKGHSYLFEAKDKEGSKQGDAMAFMLLDVKRLHDAVDEKDSRDSATDRWKRHLKRSILFVATCSQTINDKMHEMYEREGIECPPEEIPRIKKLIIRLFTIPEPQHVMEMAEKKGMCLSNDDIARVCWGIRAFEKALDEFREKGMIE
jgi:hypothetical protein